MKMKAIARFGKEFGSYKLVEVPYPTCGPEDIILEIKAAAICGTDMKHWNYEQPPTLMPTDCSVLRTPTILPNIRISWDYHPTCTIFYRLHAQ